MKLALLKASVVAGLAALAFVAVDTTPASAQTAAECDAYASRVASAETRRGRTTGIGAGVGAASGAIAGALIGGGRAAAIGAAIGAGSGAAAGAAKGTRKKRRIYEQAYRDCIDGRVGFAPARPAAVSLEPWTPAWYEYCASKYRSFNARTGTYTAYSGQKRFCR